MKKWYSILFSYLCQRFNYNLQKCSKFCILYICSLLFFIVSNTAHAQKNLDIIHQNDLEKTLELKTLALSHDAVYDGNKISVQNSIDKLPTKDSLTFQKLVPYISIVLILFVLAIVVKFLLLPEINFEEDKSMAHLNFFQQTKSILKHPQFVLSVIVLLLYLYFASEVLGVNSIDVFVKKLGVYVAAMDFYQKLILFTITAMVIGCILGMALIPKYVSLMGFLKLSCLLGALLAVTILFISPSTMIVLPGITELPVVIILVALMGFVNALFWPVIWSIVFRDFREL